MKSKIGNRKSAMHKISWLNFAGYRPQTWNPKEKHGGDVLDGEQWHEWPEVVR